MLSAKIAKFAKETDKFFEQENRFTIKINLQDGNCRVVASGNQYVKTEVTETTLELRSLLKLFANQQGLRLAWINMTDFTLADNQI